MEHPSISRVNRFGYEQLPVKVTKCSCCCESLYEGTECIKWEDDYFCDQYCLVDFFLDNMVIEKKVL